MSANPSSTVLTVAMVEDVQEDATVREQCRQHQEQYILCRPTPPGSEVGAVAMLSLPASGDPSLRRNRSTLRSSLAVDAASSRGAAGADVLELRLSLESAVFLTMGVTPRALPRSSRRIFREL
jgi:hypothetical protein